MAAIPLAGCTSTDDPSDSGNSETSNQVESVPAADEWQGPEVDTSEFHYLIENEINNAVDATLVSIADQSNADEYLPDDMEEALLVVFEQTNNSDALTRLDVSSAYVLWEQSHNRIPLLGYAQDTNSEEYEYGWTVDHTIADQVQSGSIGEDELREIIEDSVRYYD